MVNISSDHYQVHIMRKRNTAPQTRKIDMGPLPLAMHICVWAQQEDLKVIIKIFLIWTRKIFQICLAMYRLPSIHTRLLFLKNTVIFMYFCSHSKAGIRDVIPPNRFKRKTRGPYSFLGLTWDSPNWGWNQRPLIPSRNFPLTQLFI